VPAENIYFEETLDACLPPSGGQIDHTRTTNAAKAARSNRNELQEQTLAHLTHAHCVDERINEAIEQQQDVKAAVEILKQVKRGYRVRNRIPGMVYMATECQQTDELHATIWYPAGDKHTDDYRSCTHRLLTSSNQLSNDDDTSKKHQHFIAING
jgi:hypothetical protein